MTSKSLKDKFGRNFDYLRISITDRCNLKCFYCSPANGLKLFDKENILTLEEIEYLVSFFYRYLGIRKIRFTGGEPFLRKGFTELLKNVRKNLPSVDLNVTTNGILLKRYVKFLKENEIKVNVSLDTLKEENFCKITGFNFFQEVIEGIDYALSLKIPLKLNSVILKGINDGEILDLIEFSKNRGIVLRFIEYMPLSGDSDWSKYYFSEEEIKNKIKERYKIFFYEEEKIASTYILFDENLKFVSKVGFISTISKPFCKNCSRLRISSNGKAFLCLFNKNGYNLKKFLRPFIKEKELYKYIKNILLLKPEGYIKYKEKNYEMEKDFYFMRKIGG